MTDADPIRWLHPTDVEIAALRAAVAAVVRGVPAVVAAYHYGSSARGQPARDLDIAIVVDREARHSLDMDGIAADIAARCGRSTEDLDVRIVNDADPVFLGNLMREGRLCFERDIEGRVGFEVQAMNAWLDFQPAWDRLRKRVLGVWSGE